jgi:hypothetical protein
MIRRWYWYAFGESTHTLGKIRAWQNYWVFEQMFDKFIHSQKLVKVFEYSLVLRISAT